MQKIRQKTRFSNLHWMWNSPLSPPYFSTLASANEGETFRVWSYLIQNLGLGKAFCSRTTRKSRLQDGKLIRIYGKHHNNMKISVSFLTMSARIEFHTKTKTTAMIRPLFIIVDRILRYFRRLQRLGGYSKGMARFWWRTAKADRLRLWFRHMEARHRVRRYPSFLAFVPAYTYALTCYFRHFSPLFFCHRMIEFILPLQRLTLDISTGSCVECGKVMRPTAAAKDILEESPLLFPRKTNALMERLLFWSQKNR